MKDHTENIGPGGPATINGVLYQLLWSLLRTAVARIAPGGHDQGGALRSAVVTLEPRAGGDLRVAAPGELCIEQVKARPDTKRPWSLREILGDVIPDLYLGGRGEQGVIRYRFVTEGRRGPWSDVERFFERLGASPSLTVRRYEDLDDTIELYRPRRRGKFWKHERYTERRIYRLAVEQIQQKMAGRGIVEEPRVTFERLPLVLGNFEFVEGRTEALLQREIDRILLGLVSTWEDVAPCRDRMLIDIARLAVRQTTISAAEFFRSHGLDGIAVNEWAALSGRAKTVLRANQKNSQYDPGREVRPAQAREALRDWHPDAPVMVIHGEMGQGKSWLGSAILSMVSEQGPSLAVVASCGSDYAATLSRAAACVWQDVACRSSPASLEQVGKLVRNVLGRPRCQWLTLLIDDVQDVELARRLLTTPWDAWGIRTVVTCPERVAARLNDGHLAAAYFVPVVDFTDPELRQYLRMAVGKSWSAIPEDVRRPLRRPIIAESFRQVVEQNKDRRWRPESEYEVFHRLWQRLEDANAVLLLVPLVRQVLEGRPKEWDASQLQEAGLDRPGVGVLMEARWLQPVGGGARYAIPHDRLLSWAAAEVLAMDLRREPSAAESVGKRLRAFLFDNKMLGQFHPGYVAMDALWIVAGNRELAEVTHGLLSAMEPDAQDLRAFYDELVPTLGARIVPSLIERLKSCREDSMVSHFVRRSITKIGGSAASRSGLAFLHSQDDGLQLLAAEILAEHPTADAIEALWSLYVRSKASKGAGAMTDRAAFAALQQCVKLNPQWIEAMFERTVGVPEQRSSLVWLLLQLPPQEGRPIWDRHKESLLTERLPDNGRCLAVGLGRFREEGRVSWLLERLSDPDGWVCGAALQALSTIAPSQAIENLGAVPPHELSSLRDWYADQLFHFDASAMRSRLLQIIKTSSSWWSVAHVYEGREYWVDAATVEVLLKRLCVDLRRELKVQDFDPTKMRLWSAFDQIVRFRTQLALAQFRQPSSIPLAKLLLKYLEIIGPGRGRWANDGTCRNQALEILRRIDRRRFAKAIALFLEKADSVHLLEAIGLAAKSPGSAVQRRLKEAVADPSATEWSDIIRNEAATSLQELGVWRPVIEFVEAAGMTSWPTLWDVTSLGTRPSERLLAGVRGRLRSTPSAGSVLALGFGNSEVNGPVVRELLLGQDPGSDVAHACVLALRWMSDHSESVVDAIARQFDCGREIAATNALITNGSRKALLALRQRGNRQHLAVWINLVDRLGDPVILAECIQWLVQRAKQPDYRELPRDLRYLLSRIRSEEACRQIVGVAELRELCEATAYDDPRSVWNNSRADAVWYLIRADPQEGRQAGLTALSIPEIPNRDRYPHILVEAFGLDVVTDLLDHLGSEKDSIVQEALGRALVGLDLGNHIDERLGSDGSSDRKAGCMAAGWTGQSSEVAEKLTKILWTDPDPTVQRCANQALGRIAIRTETRSLAQAVIDADDHFDRWLYLDSLIEFADPGESTRPWPVDGPALRDHLSPLQVRHRKKRLEERRKKVAEELRRADRLARD